MVTTTDGQSNFIVWNLGVFGSSTTISGMRTFNPPIVAKGRIFVPMDNGVVAFEL
jgi:hypothetical protein